MRDEIRELKINNLKFSLKVTYPFKIAELVRSLCHSLATCCVLVKFIKRKLQVYGVYEADV